MCRDVTLDCESQSLRWSLWFFFLYHLGPLSNSCAEWLFVSWILVQLVIGRTSPLGRWCWRPILWQGRGTCRSVDTRWSCFFFSRDLLISRHLANAQRDEDGLSLSHQDVGRTNTVMHCAEYSVGGGWWPRRKEGRRKEAPSLGEAESVKVEMDIQAAKHG